MAQVSSHKIGRIDEGVVLTREEKRHFTLAHASFKSSQAVRGGMNHAVRPMGGALQHEAEIAQEMRHRGRIPRLLI